MAEIVLLERTGRTNVGIEGTYGTLAGTMVDVYPRTRGVIKLDEEQVKLADERPTKFAHQRNVRGAKRWSAKLDFDARPASGVLNTAASPSTPPNMLLLKALFGGESASAGSTCAAGSTTTSINVQTGHGARFAVGTMIAVEVSGTLYVRKVKAIATDALTLDLALPGSPSSGALVLNGYNYFPTQSNTQSVSMQHAAINAANLSDYNQQWECRGGTGNVTLSLEPGKTAVVGYELQGTVWAGPSTSPGLLPAPAASESQGTPWVLNNTTVLFQTTAASTTTHTPIRKLDLKFSGGMIHLPEYGGIEGTTGVERVGDGYMFVDGEITKLYDPTFDAYYASETDLMLRVVQQYGTGLTARFLVVDLPTMFLSARPVVDVDGGVRVHKFAFECREDATISSPSTDAARSPVRITVI